MKSHVAQAVRAALKGCATARTAVEACATVCVTVAALAVLAAQQPAAPPDTILVNGHVITVDARFSIADAVAISGGRFSAVGTSAAIRKLAGPKTATIDLHGQTVIPGLADGHLHDVV